MPDDPAPQQEPRDDDAGQLPRAEARGGSIGGGLRRAMDGLLLGAGAAPRFTWPVSLEPEAVREEIREGRGRGGSVDRPLLVVRELREADEDAWKALRLAENERLAPWEATLPPGGGESLSAFPAFVRRQTRRARLGEAMPFVVEVDGAFAGQVAVDPITWGATRSAQVGYWIAGAWQGRGIMRLSVALVLDHLLGPVGLHRVEINVRPENTRSLDLCRGLGLREEGLRRGYMHINGAWADHVSFAAVAEEVREPDGVGFQRRLTGG
ncbi:acetyltransferase, GNAT family [Actinomyces johnsonii F0542]|uniref:Acetyltransferase, GNAT family n=1 Tax=Actinomyces johnsonii F0542 TaxID=1321818 RepID=U1QIY0_9ACTO|nr:GNAT family protein [Actinomyces johnsonii]ERH22156.1 acetyltransferase, GNAT family [Actinomyces johnsonii F0542]